MYEEKAGSFGISKITLPVAGLMIFRYFVIPGRCLLYFIF